MTAWRNAQTRTDREVAPPRLVVGGLDFEVQLSSVRRSIGITVDRDGSLIVNAPCDCDEVDLAAFAYQKRMWVYKKLAEKDLLLSHRSTKEFVSGEGFTYLGRSHRLLVADRHAGAGKLERGRLVMRRDVAVSDQRECAMIDWYRMRASQWLPRRMEPWARRLGVEPGPLDVRDLGYRWGSLGKHNRVNFHWATIQLPPMLVYYVIVHELAHIEEPNHTNAFWGRVERAMPAFERTKHELTRIGSGLWLGEANNVRRTAPTKGAA